MLKKRLVFQLLTDGKAFYLSRNFNLQKVGDFDWLEKHFSIGRLLGSIDELAIVNISNGPIYNLEHHIKSLSDISFSPMSLTGGIRSIEDCRWLVQNGVEKLGFNSSLFGDTKVIHEAVNELGSQAILAHLDYRQQPGKNQRIAYSDHGLIERGFLEAAIELSLGVHVGEIVLHSISREGTGTGFDSELATQFEKVGIPITLSGGAGRTEHFSDVIGTPAVTGLATSNILNFMADGLHEVRKSLCASGANLANLVPPDAIEFGPE